jgi:hypothetical protein
MAQDLAGGRAAGLDYDGVQHPEILLDHAEEAAPTEPAKCEDGEEHNRRPDADKGRGDLVDHDAEPFGQGNWRKSEQEARYHEEKDPGQDQLRQADLDERTAEQRQHGASPMDLRAPGVSAVASSDDCIPRDEGLG